MLKMLSIRLIYWHLMAFCMWLSFKFQLSAAPTGYVILALKDLGKGKMQPRQVTKAQRQSRCVAVLSLSPWHQIAKGGQHHNPAALSLGQTWYHLYRRLGGPQGLSGWEWKVSPPVVFNPQTVHPIARLLYQLKINQLCYTKGLIKTQKSKFNF
jgi:hypothetical protein